MCHRTPLGRSQCGLHHSSNGGVRELDESFALWHINVQIGLILNQRMEGSFVLRTIYFVERFTPISGIQFHEVIFDTCPLALVASLWTLFET